MRIDDDHRRVQKPRGILQRSHSSMVAGCIVCVSIVLLGSVMGCGRKGPPKPLKERPAVNAADSVR
jgi:hypothetical protein